MLVDKRIMGRWRNRDARPYEHVRKLLSISVKPTDCQRPAEESRVSPRVARQKVAGIESCPAHLILRNDMKRKPVQLDEKTHGLIQKEAIRQSTKPGFTVTMGGVVAQLAKKLRGRK